QGDPTDLTVSVELGTQTAQARVRRTQMPAAPQVDVLLVDHPGYFDRAGIYVQNGTDFPDNAERFVFFSRAALEICQTFDLPPDVIHVHDWQTALVPALLAPQAGPHGRLTHTATVLT